MFNEGCQTKIVSNNKPEFTSEAYQLTMESLSNFDSTVSLKIQREVSPNFKNGIKQGKQDGV